MKSIYVIKINSKYFNHLLRYIKIEYIKKQDNYYYLYLDEYNYKKTLKFKKIFEIEFVDYKGFIKYKRIFLNNLIFFIMFFLAIIYITILSNMIFSIDIKTDDEEIKQLLIKELDNYGISLYKFTKTFAEKEKIKQQILNNNKDKLEWLEITRHGSKYILNVEKRIIKKIDDDETPQDIVASKNAIIVSIEATRGNIVKKLNDYVKKGDVIVSGTITHKDEVVDLVKANAMIYGETWYNVHVSYPFSYYEKTYTGKTLKRINFNFLGKNINLGRNFKQEEITEIKIMNNKFLPIKLGYQNVKEIVLIDDLYTVEEAYIEAIKLARERLLKELPNDSKILNQKKLKIIVNNSTIDVDIFFKVYENITAIKKLESEDNV